MREILFRGKTNYEGKDAEWVYGGLLPESASTFPIIVRDYDNDEEWIGILDWATVDSETVGQYTGLTDKNGRKIFEGDICQIADISYIDETPFVIEWNDEYSGWFWRELNYASATDTVTPEIAKMAKVIGNIHDSPELLKGE